MADEFNFQRAFDKCKSAWEIFQKDMVNFGLTILLGALAISVTFGVLSGPVMIGILKSVRKLQKDEKVEFNDAFSAMSYFLPSFLLCLIIGAGIGVIIGIFWVLTIVIGAITRGCGFCFMYPLVVIVWIICSGLGQILMLMGLLFISEENADFQGALKKAFSWITANKKKAMEFFVTVVICSLAGIVPVVGGIVALGLITISATLYYDEEKQAGTV
jgi:hypothetical protein